MGSLIAAVVGPRHRRPVGVAVWAAVFSCSLLHEAAPVTEGRGGGLRRSTPETLYAWGAGGRLSPYFSRRACP